MNIFIITEIILSIVLSALILIQQQGAGLGGAFGGEGNVYRSKRGIEKFLFNGTIVVGFLFFATAVVAVLFKK